MRARLFARTGPLAGTGFEIGEEATIGRTPENQVVLPGGLISGRHGRIWFDPRQGCYLVEDLGSRNGTFLAGARVREPEKLERLDVVSFATFDFIFQVLDEALDETAAPAVVVAVPERSSTRFDRDGAPLPAGLPSVAAAAAGGGTLRGALDDFVLPGAAAGGGTQRGEIADFVLPGAAPPEPAVVWELRVELGEGSVVHPLPPGERVVGRAPECDVSLDDRSLSRRHARLAVAAERVSIADLGSTNGTFVAGEKLAPEVATALAPGAELHFGTVRATLERRSPGAGARREP